MVQLDSKLVSIQNMRFRRYPVGVNDNKTLKQVRPLAWKFPLAPEISESRPIFHCARWSSWRGMTIYLIHAVIIMR
jgi:hypothetical protein